MSTLKRFALILTLIALTACSTLAKSALADNQRKWEKQHITHYRIALSIGCFCAFRNQMPLSVEVKDNRIISIVDRQGKPVTESKDTFEQYASVEKLFGVLDSALNGGADKVTVKYNTDYGYPQSINIDYIAQAADDEMSFTISKFEIVEQGK